VSRSHTGVALSIAVHVIVFAIAVGWAARQPRTAVFATREPLPEPAPIEIEMYVEPAPAPVVASASGAAAPRIAATGAAAPPAIRVRRAAMAEVARAVPVPEPTEAAPMAIPALPSTAVIDRIVEQAPSKTAPAVGAPTPSTFAMRIAPDGTARITDRRNLRFAPGTNAAEAEEARAERWMDDHHERSNAVDMKLPPAGATVARFDVTDWAMRSAGSDPYAHEKLKVLDATRDARAEIGARHREQQARGVPALVRASLDEIAALTSEMRSAALLDLWRDCDDSTAGEIARMTIVEYVRTHAQFSAADRAALAR